MFTPFVCHSPWRVCISLSLSITIAPSLCSSLCFHFWCNNISSRRNNNDTNSARKKTELLFYGAVVFQFFKSPKSEIPAAIYRWMHCSGLLTLRTVHELLSLSVYTLYVCLCVSMTSEQQLILNIFVTTLKIAEIHVHIDIFRQSNSKAQQKRKPYRTRTNHSKKRTHTHAIFKPNFCEWKCSLWLWFEFAMHSGEFALRTDILKRR